VKYLPWIAVVTALLVLCHEEGVPYADWMNSLRQPRYPASCCGVADQYWVQEYAPSHRKGIAFVAVVLARDGNNTFTVDVPDDKVIWNTVNPTGRGVIFIGGSDEIQSVVCFVPGTGT